MDRRIVTLLALGLLFVGCKKQTVQPTKPAPTERTEASPRSESDAPRRIVLFIGDGMGIGQLTAGSYLNGAPLRMLQLPRLGYMTTHSYQFLTTDSAASATAISTGRKTHFDGLSVTPGTTEAEASEPSHRMQTLLELAEANELRTGVVATSRIVHATPAAFLSHVPERHDYEGIARQIADSGVDVLMGAGSQYFDAREDGDDLLASMTEDGFYVAKSAEQLEGMPKTSTKLAALMHPKDMPFVTEGGRAMPLADMVSTAIDVLDRDNDNGWVLVVEGSFIDWCGHQLEGACAAMEVNDLDQAVGRAIDYADGRDDTLVVATADHETGGLSVIDPYYSERFAKILGGYDTAASDTALPPLEGEPRPSPPPFEFVGIGSLSAELLDEPQPSPDRWGMTDYDDGRASLVHGYFSVASRPMWQRPERFYAAHTPTMVSIHAGGPGAEQVVDARDNADLGQALRGLVEAGATQGTLARTTPPAGDPKNVILMVGDGMGLPSVTGAYYHRGGLNMVDLPYRGLVNTHAVDHLVNDSAATATAMATGVRTRKKTIGKIWKDRELRASETVLERAESAGRATGIVTTTPITHATPAAFYAHRDTRYETDGILSDLASMPTRIEGSDGIDLLIGGGQQKVTDDARAMLGESGYQVIDSWPPPDDDGPLVGILAEDGLDAAAKRAGDDDPSTPTLSEMTTVALKRLSSDPDGFFLVVEGGQIDWRLHGLTRDAALFEEVVDFDDAVGVARDFAAQRGDTLVIVTADHDHTMSLLDNHYAFESGRCNVAERCGGPWEMPPIAVHPEGVRNAEGLSAPDLQGNFATPRLFVQYAWPIQEAAQRVDVGASHSANFVPLFAYGPWADRLEGFLDQPAIGRMLLEWASK